MPDRVDAATDVVHVPYFATNPSVTFSPPPPMRSGGGPGGAPKVADVLDGVVIARRRLGAVEHPAHHRQRLAQPAQPLREPRPNSTRTPRAPRRPMPPDAQDRAPAETWSSVLASLAVRVGARKASAPTIRPIRTWCVACAQAVIVSQPSEPRSRSMCAYYGIDVVPRPAAVVAQLVRADARLAGGVCKSEHRSQLVRQSSLRSTHASDGHVALPGFSPWLTMSTVDRPAGIAPGSRASGSCSDPRASPRPAHSRSRPRSDGR